MAWAIVVIRNSSATLKLALRGGTSHINAALFIRLGSHLDEKSVLRKVRTPDQKRLSEGYAVTRQLDLDSISTRVFSHAGT